LALAGRLDRRNAGSVATDAFTGMLGGPTPKTLVAAPTAAAPGWSLHELRAIYGLERAPSISPVSYGYRDQAEMLRPAKPLSITVQNIIGLMVLLGSSAVRQLNSWQGAPFPQGPGFEA